MLYHHDTRDAAQAGQAAADRAKDNLHRLISSGPALAGAALSQMEREEPKDHVVSSKDLGFLATDEGVHLNYDNPQHTFMAPLHRNALSQACTKVGLPHSYMNQLDSDPRRKALLAHNLNELYEMKSSRHLVRAVEKADGNTEVRAFLSDKFRRMDSVPIISAFVKAGEKVGAVPVEAVYTGLRMSLKMLLPEVFEPAPNQVMAYGLCLQTSDFGAGALYLRVFCLRLWCTNYALTEDLVKKVHLSKRLPDDLALSAETYRLDTATMVSAIRDITQSGLSKDSIVKHNGMIRDAYDEGVSAADVKAFLKKRLNKDEANQVIEVFSSPDVSNVPPGQNRLRLSNAISWVAQSMDDGRMLEMQKVAGDAMAVA